MTTISHFSFRINEFTFSINFLSIIQSDGFVSLKMDSKAFSSWLGSTGITTAPVRVDPTNIKQLMKKRNFLVRARHKKNSEKVATQENQRKRKRQNLLLLFLFFQFLSFHFLLLLYCNFFSFSFSLTFP